MSIDTLVAKRGFKATGRVALETPGKLFDREFIKDHLYVNVLDSIQTCEEPLIEGSLTLSAEDEDDYKMNIESVFNFVQYAKRSSNHVIMQVNHRLKSGILILSKFNTVEQLVVAIDQRAQHDAAFEQDIKGEYDDVLSQNVAKDLYL